MACCQKTVKNYAARPHVSRVTVQLLLRLTDAWREELGSHEHQAAAAATHRVQRGASKTKVDQLQLAVDAQDVIELDIPMGHILAA